jgi:exopolysaccharide production protein ExoQ
MSSSHHLNTGPALRVGRPPWLIFLFLAAVFFSLGHDLSYSENAINNYNLSEAALVAKVADGSLIRQIALLSLGIFAIVSLVRHRAERRIGIKSPLGCILLGFAAWALFSPIWAEDLTLTLKRSVVFGILCIAAAAIARRFSFREIVLWTLSSTLLFLVIGVLAEVFLGTFRPWASGYRFAGTIHPNAQAVNCTLLLLSAMTAADMEEHRRTIFRVCALLGFVFLILTTSRTAVAAALFAVVVYLAAVCSRPAKIVMAYSLTMVFGLLLLFVGNGLLPDLKGAVMLGRDNSSVDSFNGRTGIWDGVAPYIQQRPILGYGYGGFWTPTHMSAISEEEKWGVSSSHSAYLDYFLTLGAVGLVAYAFLLLAGIKRAFRFQRLSRSSAFAFCGALLVFYALDGLLDSATVEPSLPMFLCMVVLVSLALKDISHVSQFRQLPATG